jgi:beta-phosphoglucomutase-like phosphatase (HAD superfamily)
MGCSSSKAATSYAANPNLISQNQGNYPTMSGKRLSIAMPCNAEDVLSVEPDSATPAHVISTDDIAVMLDKVSVPGSRTKRGSLCISSTTELETKNTFKNKTVDEQGNASRLASANIAFTCRKGLKPTSPNQDSYVVAVADDISIYGVFDGHGTDGHLVSNYVKEILPKLVLQDPLFGESDKRAELLKKCFVQTHKMVEAACSAKQFDARLSGATATLILHDHVLSKLHVAHVGDSGCCVGKKTSAGWIGVPLTKDHKPEDPTEQARINSGGGQIVHDGYANHRVFAKGKSYPGMNMTRAMGDIVGHKEAGITAEPTVNEVQLAAEDQLLLVCSDGVWEFLEAQEVVEIVGAATFLQKGVDDLAEKSSDSWMREENGTCVDDITAIAVMLQDRKHRKPSCRQMGDKFTKPRAVLFDFDGSLAQSEEAHRKRFVAATGVPCDSARWDAECVGRNTEWIVCHLLGVDEPPAEVMEDLRQRVVSDAFLADVAPTKGGLELLRALRETPPGEALVPCAIVTSGIRAYIEACLERWGVQHLVGYIVAGDHGVKHKPAPDPYLTACKHFGVEPSDCVAVEDSPSGLQSALAAGCAVVAINNTANAGLPLLDEVRALRDDLTDRAPFGL